MSQPLWEKYLGVPMLRVHDLVYRKSGGLLGHRIPGFAPMLLLHAVGAKSGLPRTTALTYAEDGDGYLVVASNGGAPKAPGWLFNLRKQPDIEINLGTRRLPVHARVVLPDDADYDRLWARVNKVNRDAYREYQRRTTRPIPVVELTPR